MVILRKVSSHYHCEDDKSFALNANYSVELGVN